MIKGLKDKKFLVILLIACVAVALVLGIIVGGAPQRHNNSLKKTISKTLTPIAEECGLTNFEVVYVDDQYSVKIVLSCDNMSTISYDKKTKFFNDSAEAMKNKGSKYEFYSTSKIALYSDGNRYTASADTLTSKIYENGTIIDPTTNAIKVTITDSDSTGTVNSGSTNNKTNNSSNKNNNSSNKTTTTKSCKGGVSCRAGYTRCNPHPDTGYCRSCCKTS